MRLLSARHGSHPSSWPRRGGLRNASTVKSVVTRFHEACLDMNGVPWCRAHCAHSPTACSGAAFSAHGRRCAFWKPQCFAAGELVPARSGAVKYLKVFTVGSGGAGFCVYSRATPTDI